jgi:hypothetical protein
MISPSAALLVISKASVQSRFFNRQGMIAGEAGGFGYGTEQALPVVADFFRLAVDDALSLDDSRAEGLGNGLVAKAYPKDRDLSGEGLN